jgi:signal transduction histidine kinase/CheY-like chemotaxis protein
MWQTISHGQVWSGEICNRRKDGSLYWVFSTIMPVLDANQKIAAYMAVRTDITIIKQQAQRLIKLQEYTQKALEREIHAMALVSHELRTPISGILGITDLLLHGENLDAEIREALLIVQQSGESLLGVVNDLLNYARLRNHRIPILRSEFYPYLAFETVFDCYEQMAACKDLGFYRHLDVDKDLYLVGDVSLMRQILSNLLNNAIRYTSSGQIHSSVTVVPLDGMYRMDIIVTDTGSGITKETLGRVQESFTQSLDYARRRYGGLGLGLTICRELAIQMGGHLDIESEVDKGTRVSVSFYCHAPKQVEAHSKMDWVRFSKKRVLLIDPVLESRKQIMEALSTLGCSIDLANSEMEAIARYQAMPFDLILINLESVGAASALITLRLRELENRLLTETVIVGLGNKALEYDSYSEVRRDQDLCLELPLKKQYLLEAIAVLFDIDQQKQSHLPDFCQI